MNYVAALCWKDEGRVSTDAAIICSSIFICSCSILWHTALLFLGKTVKNLLNSLNYWQSLR